MINHFYKNIHGWVDGIDYLYKQIVDFVPSDRFLHFVEIGSWKGCSSAFMAVEIANSGKNIQFDCVDTWKGSEEHQEDPSIVNDTLYDEFINNMKPVEGLYRPVRMPSLAAAACYDNESLDFVFIDAAHDYDNVRADILAWFPKVKVGGIIAGHDFSPTATTNVSKAVRELFTEFSNPIHCWVVQKNQNTKLNLG
jgi:Methyltransferase domain